MNCETCDENQAGISHGDEDKKHDEYECKVCKTKSGEEGLCCKVPREKVEEGEVENAVTEEDGAEEKESEEE